VHYTCLWIETNCRCSPRGFAAVFAEDVTDVQSTDVVSGECICFCQRVGCYAKLVNKLLGMNCAPIIIRILRELASNNYFSTRSMRSLRTFFYSIVDSDTTFVAYKY
jgi:hypothetical protein